jgi:son of sevenless-like protein
LTVICFLFGSQAMVVIVRALYDYNATDSSNLTFQAGDLIQVFTQLDSGWWDGLLHENRGWFPSNYVQTVEVRSRIEENSWVKRSISSSSANLAPPRESDNNSESQFQYFWYNEVTGESVWQRPRSVILLPEGWAVQETEDRQGHFFFNEEDEQISWTLPAQLWDPEYVKGAYRHYDKFPEVSSSAKDSIGFVSKSLQSELNSIPAISPSAESTDYHLSERSQLNLVSAAPLSPRHNSRESTSNAEVQMKSWSLFTQKIFSAIQVLLKAAKDSEKAKYIPNSSSIVDAIRSMLVSADAVDKESATLRVHPMLRQHHRALLASLSRLVLSAKLASGVWPPPDAAQKMIGDASELLASVRGFVEAARECAVEVSVTNPDASNYSISGSSQPNSPRFVESDVVTQRRRSSSISPSSPIRTPGSTGRRNSNYRGFSMIFSQETISQLDKISSEVLRTLSSLHENTQGSITVAVLIKLTREAVTQVGQFLSLIEDVQLEEGPESPLLHEFKINKQSLYNNIAGLVMATQTATDAQAPINAMEQVNLAVSVVERSVKDLLGSTQQLFDAKYRKEHRRTSALLASNSLAERSVPLQKPLGTINTELANARHYGGELSPVQQVLETSPVSKYLMGPMSAPPIPPAPQYLVHQPRVVSASFPVSGMHSRNSQASSPPATPYSSKLRRFFGDDVDPSSMPSSHGGKGTVEVPWYLTHDYALQEIVFTVDGSVKGGSLPALIERLTLHDEYDAGFTTSFLFSYRTFMTSSDFFEALVARFSIQPPPCNPSTGAQITDTELENWIEKKMTPIRLRVFNVMKTWLENYCLPYIPDDALVLEKMRHFARGTMRPVMSLPSVQLIKLIDRRESSSTPHLPLRGGSPTTPTTPTSPGNPPPPVLPRSLKKLKLIDLDPLEVARQLTLVEYSLFSRLIYTEFLNKAWSAEKGNSEEAKARAPNLRRMIDMSNSITGWIAESILAEEDPKKRCSLLKHYILIADKCRTLNNFNTLFSILAALNSAPIHRLARTWEQLSTKTLSLMDDLRKVTDPHKNFSAYREMLHASAPPCIPFLGRYLSDLTFLEDGNPNVIKLPSSPSFPNHHNEQPVLFNFAKRAKCAEIIREIQQFQLLQFNLRPVPEVQEFLLSMVNSNRESEELYEISLNREPREREDQKLVRLLEESGLL